MSQNRILTDAPNNVQSVKLSPAMTKMLTQAASAPLPGHRYCKNRTVKALEKRGLIEYRYERGEYPWKERVSDYFITAKGRDVVGLVPDVGYKVPTRNTTLFSSSDAICLAGFPNRELPAPARRDVIHTNPADLTPGDEILLAGKTCRIVELGASVPIAGVMVRAAQLRNIATGEIFTQNLQWAQSVVGGPKVEAARINPKLVAHVRGQKRRCGDSTNWVGGEYIPMPGFCAFLKALAEFAASSWTCPKCKWEQPEDTGCGDCGRCDACCTCHDDETPETCPDCGLPECCCVFDGPYHSIDRRKARRVLAAD